MKKIKPNNKFYFDYKLYFVIFVLLFLIFAIENRIITYASSKVSSQCSETFLSGDDSNTPTHSLIRYLNELYEIGALVDSDIHEFHKNLTFGKMVNPIEPHLATTNPAASIQAHTIDDFLSLQDLNLNQVIEWCKKIINRNETVTNFREQIDQDVKLTNTPLLFYTIEIPRKLMGMTIPNYLRTPRIIEVASTPVTEMHWYSLLGDLPHWSDKRSLRIWFDIHRVPVPIIVKNNRGEDISLRPNYPVIEFNVLTALIFANMMSLQQNLEPAYDLSDLKLGDEYNGYYDLIPEGVLKPTSEVYQVKFNTKANGYRLPNRDEQLFLLGLSKLDKSKKTLEQLDKLLDDSLLNPIHHKVGGFGDVGELPPRWVGGKPFYDLFGGTFEIEQQLANTNRRIFYIQSPEKVFVNFFSSGANCFSKRDTLFRDMIEQQNNPLKLDDAHPYRSFRLVRTIRP